MLEKIDIKGNGFNILKDYDSWTIATLGYDDNSNSIRGINKLGRHLETIEVFVLIEGSAYMVTAGNEDEPSNLCFEKLEKGRLYIVQEKQWHGAILEPESTLLIIENRDTSNLNSEEYILNKSNKQKIEDLYSQI